MRFKKRNDVKLRVKSLFFSHFSKMAMDFISQLAPFAKTVGIDDAYLMNKVLPQVQAGLDILHLRNGDSVLPIKIRASPIHGNGCFATREIKKGEVFMLRFDDLSVLSSCNDGAFFPEWNQTNIKIEDFYKDSIIIYNRETNKNSNCEIIISIDDLTKSGTLVILQDILRDTEFLRSYGIPSWIASELNRLNSVNYKQWTMLMFKPLLKASSSEERFAAMLVLLTHLIMSQMNQDSINSAHSNIIEKKRKL